MRIVWADRSPPPEFIHNRLSRLLREADLTWLARCLNDFQPQPKLLVVTFDARTPILIAKNLRHGESWGSRPSL
jgi:hypothetical protein